MDNAGKFKPLLSPGAISKERHRDRAIRLVYDKLKRQGWNPYVLDGKRALAYFEALGENGHLDMMSDWYFRALNKHQRRWFQLDWNSKRNETADVMLHDLIENTQTTTKH